MVFVFFFVINEIVYLNKFCIDVGDSKKKGFVVEVCGMEGREFYFF